MTTRHRAAALAKRLNTLQNAGNYEDYDAIYARETVKARARATTKGGDVIDMGNDWFVHFHHGAFHSVYSPTRMLTIHPAKIDKGGIVMDVDSDIAGTVHIQAIHDNEDPTDTMTIIMPRSDDRQ